MDHKSALKISGNSSVIIDSLRLCSALTVLYIHTQGQLFPEKVHLANKPGNISHAAVIVFFVLSGYVISYTTITRNRGRGQYARARLSRLYSVVIPALILSVFAEIIVSKVDPVLYLDYYRGYTLVRYTLTTFFLNEIWFLSSAPPINGPLWSLSYEFWYYVIFGLWVYRNKTWKSLVWPLGACIIAGPKILFMMPIWLFGCIAYRMKKVRISIYLSYFFMLISFISAFICMMTVTPLPYGIDATHFTYANQFLTDWIIGFFVAVALYFMPNEKVSLFSSTWVNKFRNIADLTFPIYALHHPLLIIWRSIFHFEKVRNFEFCYALCSVLVVSIVTGIFLEKYRFKWGLLIGWIIEFFQSIQKKYIYN